MRLFLALVLSVCIAVSGFTQTGTQAAKQSELQLSLDKKVQRWQKVFDDVSIAVAYIENGKVSWISIYGNQVPGGPPANDKTLYSVASLTKPITAEVILRLASDGKLSLDEPISANWTDPDVKDNPWSRLLTARLCLSHQTGFPNWRYQTENVLRFQWEPGTRTGYSGEGYEYVARYAEKKIGDSFEDLAKQYVFDPIGMRDTSYTPQPWWEGRLAKPFESKPRTQLNAADLLRATVGDYAKFVVSVMHNEGVSKEIAAERFKITRNQVTPEIEAVLCEESKDPAHCKVAAGPGLGWRIVTINGETIVDHSGNDGDVKTFAFFVPRLQTGAVIFTCGNDYDFTAIERHQRVIRKIVGVLYPDRVYVETMTNIL
ncbi:MAG TPA: serine hydrolase domain-containing protein [Terriglobia bacterium]|nr:serine hydrolase domain-containing protein [Terriglobia bacterium]